MSLLLTTSCLLLADPPELYDDTSPTSSIGDGWSSESNCDRLSECCAAIDAEDWQRDACYSDVSYGEEDICGSTLCNWGSRDEACVQSACDVGCALGEC